MIRSLRLATRQILNAPGFSMLAVAMLVLGIGACALMFSVVYTVLLKPLPFEQPERLVWIENNGSGDGLSDRTSQLYNYTAWREQNETFSDIAAYYAFYEYLQYTLSGEGDSLRLRGVPVTQNFFEVLGVQPALGRGFDDAEMAWNAGAATAAVLSHGFWMQRFGADPDVVGQTLTIDGAPVRVAGVMPAAFDFDSVFSPGSGVQMLVPFPQVEQMHNEGNTLFAIGRLRPGATLAQAQQELSGISARTAQQHPERGLFDAELQRLDDHVRGSFRPAFAVLFAAVLCLLLIVCLNLSSLLLARAQARRKEWVTRVALGASQWQLVREPLLESLILALAGGVGGLVLAQVGIHALGQLAVFSVPLLQGARLGLEAVLFSVLVSAGAGLICGVFPALQLWRADAAGALNDGTARGSAGPAAARTRKVLVVSQIALACALLIASSLLIRSFVAVLQIELGFNPDQVVAWRVDSARNFKSNAERVSYYQALLQRVREIPGVSAAGLSDTLPFGRNRGWGAAAKGVSYPKGSYPVAAPRIIDDGYLQTLQVPLLAGRYLQPKDTDAAELRAMVVNQTMASQLWPGRDPLGQVVMNGDNEIGRVVGVVADIPRSLEQTPNPEMYFSITQIDDWSSVELVVRSTRDRASLVPEVRAAIRLHDPEMATGDVYTLNQIVDRVIAPRRLTTTVLGGFSALALLLAGMGVYGVVSYSVGQRDKELAIRRALGGPSAHVARLILGEGVRVALLGAAVGLLIALLGVRMLNRLLYGVDPLDPFIFASNLIAVAGVALVAAGIPALRASRISPAGALR